MNFLKRLFARREPETDLFNPEIHAELMNPELQQAIEAVTANNTSTTRRKLYEVLLETTFCIPSSASDDKEGTSQISATQNEAGELVLVAFSDPAALRRWEQNPEAMLVMPAQQLFQLALDNNFAEILINPAGPAGGKLARHEFARLAQGVIPE